jgi:DNA-binding MarR family transcriptional regulator
LSPQLLRVEPENTSREAAVRAYTRLLRAHATTARCLSAGLLERYGLSLNDYEALHALAETQSGFMKRVELARSLGLTPSGITRLLEGLEVAGLVERASCPSDLRVTYARLTSRGAGVLADARRDHEERIGALFEDALSDDEIETFGELLARLSGVEFG